MVNVDAPPGAELRKFLLVAERRRRLAAFLRAAPRHLLWLTAVALAAVLALEALGTRVSLRTRVNAAFTVLVGAAALAAASARRTPSPPTPRWLDERIDADGLVETSTEIAGSAKPASPLGRLCVLAAERRIARERPSLLVPMEAPRIGFAVAMLAVLVLSALLPPMPFFGRGPRGLGAGSGESTVGAASRERPRATGSASRPRPESRPKKQGSTPDTKKEPEREKEKETPKGPSSKPSPKEPERPPEEIPPFVATPKAVPIDPRGGLTSRRETEVIDLPEPEAFGARAAAPARTQPLDARKIEALRRAAERALSNAALDPAERAFVARYFEILAR